MLIEFEDHSYVELKLSPTPGKAFLVLGGLDVDNPLKHRVSSVELTLRQLSELVAGLNVQLPVILNNKE